ncbi:MAG: DUF47 domain-containing protein [Verrucomicrobiia bacterium]|jgi:uncharacterized protein Yka (UPF0111/DUF47 family)
MFSLQRILGHDKKFFELFEESIKEAKNSVDILKKMINSGATKEDIARLSSVRQKNKQIAVEVKTLLCKTFVTGFDREDLEDLANAIYKIPKTIEKFAERFNVARNVIKNIDFSRHTALIEEELTILSEMLEALRKEESEKLMDLNQKLHKVEVRGDELLNELVCELYSGKYESLQVIILKDLFEMLEKVLDRSRSAGNVMYRIILKHS